MLLPINDVMALIEKKEILSLAADEKLLEKLPKGNWIAGTIPYFMSQNHGEESKDKIFVNRFPEFIKDFKIKYYNEKELSNIPKDAPENGFSLIIIPATSKAHISYAHNAPNYEDIFLKPIIGWISGVHLDDLGTIKPKVFNGQTGEKNETNALVMHLTLPSNKMANIGIINIFEQGDGDTIEFDTEGFTVKDCLINGKQHNFSEYLLNGKIDTKLPLVADYCGAMVNVSFQSIDEKDKIVNFYAPVFKDVQYKIAKPIGDYVKEFTTHLEKDKIEPIFSCNCILNYLYSELNNRKTGNIIGPITFGEIAYQLLNQTLTYLELKDV
ncbi:MAG: hypothetical protein A2086_08065 [Spirochaetes bacterium GWD1_27_9]|nr:MAG: hypothetical protein A2Y34_16795 [Spirochaetes bacterium GWC1_27_15]OHD34475.1 MAG: hypothetical protein A2086_08065 [Spirochaetes bacterium GWD1_27_9]